MVPLPCFPLPPPTLSASLGGLPAPPAAFKSSDAGWAARGKGESAANGKFSAFLGDFVPMAAEPEAAAAPAAGPSGRCATLVAIAVPHHRCTLDERAVTCALARASSSRKILHPSTSRTRIHTQNSLLHHQHTPTLHARPPSVPPTTYVLTAANPSWAAPPGPRVLQAAHSDDSGEQSLPLPTLAQPCCLPCQA